MNSFHLLMKGKTAVIFLLLFSHLGFSQGGWMRKYDFGMPGTVICSILKDSGNYWISGVAADTLQLPTVVAGTIIGKINGNGNEIFHHYIAKSDTSIECWNKEIKKIGNDSIVLLGTSFLLGENFYVGCVLNFHISTGTINYKLLPIDTFFTFFSPKSMLQFDQKVWVSISTSIQGIPNSNFQLIRTNLHCYNQEWDELGREIFNGPLDSVARNELCNLELVDDSCFLIGFNSIELDGINPSNARTIIKKITASGTELWSYESPVNSKEGIIAHLHQNSDKSIVYAVNAFVDKLYANGDCCFYTYRGRVVKIDTLGNRLWERNWGYDTGGDYPFQAMHVNTDESVIAVGVGGDIDFTDTLESGQKGYITKTSASGDSLWSRLYLIRNQQYHWHNFMDIEATNDGGYILCGRSAINGPVFPDEQFTAMAWIVKTDSMGCVVPGCHLVGVDEEKKQRPKVLVYPNPAHDYLAVFVPASMATQQLQIQLLNLEGKVVLEDQFTQSDATYLLELKNISAGLYVLKVLQNGEVLQAEKVVVE
jgi:hypothetical protein